MINRFDDKLRESHQLIAVFSHGNRVLRVICAIELKKEFSKRKNPRILEIGCGEGDFTEYLMRYNPGFKIDILDISPEMIEAAKIKLALWRENINFICEDGLEFLKNSTENYDLIVSSWTIHNFSWKEKLELFKVIRSRLNDGGKLFLLDKIYPDNLREHEKRFEILLQRYQNYLPEDLKREVIAHAKQDFSEDYRMDESKTIKRLKESGFREAKIIDREAEEAILAASK
ncbi:MAG: class I SAM-dependent methyltransferase [bacterium]